MEPHIGKLRLNENPPGNKKNKKVSKGEREKNDKNSIASFRIYPAQWIQRLWLYGL